LVVVLTENAAMVEGQFTRPRVAEIGKAFEKDLTKRRELAKF
jgi:hypothetical protein